MPPEEYFKSDVRLVEFGAPKKQDDLYLRYFPGMEPSELFSINDWGVGAKKSEDSIYHFTRRISPLENAETLNELIDYPMPDFTQSDSELDKQVADIHSSNLAAAGQGDLTLFEMAWLIRGYEQFLEDLLLRPDFAECLLDRIFKIRLFMVKRLAAAGVDVLTCGDDVSCQRGMLINPELFRSFLKPRYDILIHTAKTINKDLLIFFHSDGNPEAIIPDLIEVGVNILNPCQPECNDFDMLKKTYGKDLSFWGAIGIQELLPFGTRDDIRREVRHLKETLGSGGGLLLGPTHVIEPEVPWENLVVLYEAIEEFGRYK